MQEPRRVEIAPEPAPEAAAAIRRALATPRVSDAAPSPWWRAGVEDSVLEDAVYATARPRRSAGAERA